MLLLHAHHDGENEPLYPLLVERVPAERELFASLESQHRGGADTVAACVGADANFGESATAIDGVVLADACDDLAAALTPHLDEEEVAILPVAARYASPEEWGLLSPHVIMSYRGERIWLPLGLATEAFAAAFTGLMTDIRATS